MSLLNRFRSVFSKSHDKPADGLNLNHPQLGHLQGTSEMLQGTLLLGAGKVTLSVSPDGQPIEQVMALAERVVAQIDALSAKALAHIGASYLSTYNESWRAGETLKPDGTYQPFENPTLTLEGFLPHFSLSAIGITGTRMAALWYTCGELFWGHEVSVTSLDGDAFNDLHAELHG
jgi:hypothetical protein